MPRAKHLSFVLTIAILLNGLTLAIVWTRGPAHGEGQAEVVAVVERFYDAINIAIATGDVQPVDALTSPTYVDRNPLPSQVADRQGLIEHLRALHVVNPALQLQVREMVVRGNWARVDLALSGRDATPATFTDAHLWREHEELAVRAGQIGERRGGNAGLVEVTFGCGFEFPAIRGDEILRVMRIDMPPRASNRVSSPLGPLGVLVVTGSATAIDVRTDSSARSAAETGLTQLNQGSAMLAPSGMHRISSGNDGAVLLLFSQQVESVLGGPWNDPSDFDPRVRATEALSASEPITCTELLLMPDASILMPDSSEVVIVPDPSLGRCRPAHHIAFKRPPLHNCHAEPVLVLILV